MLGAIVLTIASGEVAQAVVPLITGLLLAFVAYGRWRGRRDRGTSAND
jgi:hypothetical protein